MRKGKQKTLSDYRPGLRPPTFSVRTLLAAVALICVFLVIFQRSGPVGKCTLILGTMVVFAHVAGNALGVKLRASGNRPQILPVDDPPAVTTPAPLVARPDQFAPATNLGHTKSLGRGVYIWVGTGAILGAVCVGSLLMLFNPRSSAGSVVLGSMSAAVMGGMFSFGAFSFLRTTFSAWYEAQQDSNRADHVGLFSRLMARFQRQARKSAQLRPDTALADHDHS